MRAGSDEAGPTRQGPTLTLALWDPARGTAALREDTEDAVTATRLPVTVEDGSEEGLLHLHVWAGSLGLGLPTDTREAWDELGLALGPVAAQVAPALALCAPEWAAGSLVEPDVEELRPGLASGWARRRGLDPTRVASFDQLAAREVVATDERGWTWQAAGAVPLGQAPPVEADRLVPAVFHAWWGRRPGDHPTPSPCLVLTAAAPDRTFVAAVAAALPDGYRVEARSPSTVVAEPPAWARDQDTLERDLADAALLVEARRAEVVVDHGPRRSDG